jgi:ribosomal protein S27E
MSWEQIKLQKFNEEIHKLVNESPCDNCGETEHTWYSHQSYTILCPICKDMVQRICENRNKRTVRIEQLRQDMME